MNTLAHIERRLPSMYVRFYAVGLLLYAVPFTRNFFVSIITLSLVLAFASAFRFNRDWRRPQIVWACFIVVSSFFLEYYGVATGDLFGEYAYGRGLAPLVKGTPLIIGFNWLFLIYSTHLIANRITPNAVARILCASLLMIGYDLVAEWVAPPMRMWSFSGGYPPLRNFAVWFVASVIYHAGFEVFPLRHDNHPARLLYVFQVVFFLLIGLYSTLVIR